MNTKIIISVALTLFIAGGAVWLYLRSRRK